MMYIVIDKPYMVNIELKNTGEYEIAKSGVVHVFEDRDTIIAVNDLELVINFRTEENVEPSVQLQGEEKTLRVTFTNFNNSLGLGNTEPIQIAQFEDKHLFFIYRIFSLSDKRIRTIEYTFLLK